ncbi:hypothetical protein EDF60_1647 [Leucobacter luti]|nr:hypothetical protein [Leucobacter luti]TCK41222.1 hypothetical protein EDF60_1647 [Leucobacter luti]
MGFWESVGSWIWQHAELLLVGAVPVVISVIAISMSARSLRYERASAEASARSALAAERANLLTERLLEREHLVERPADEKPDVSWTITNPSGGLFVLRNTGSDVAEDVTIPEDLMSGVPKHLPNGAVVRPGDAAEFYVFGRWGSPVPHTAYVQWRGQDEPIAVPMPV